MYCTKMFGRFVNLNREVYYCILFASMAVVLTASTVKRDKCGFLHGISNQGWTGYFTQEIKRICKGQLKNDIMQYNCNDEETASAYAAMKDLRSNEIQNEMFVYVWGSQNKLEHAFSAFERQGLCKTIKEESLTDYGCASAMYAYRTDRIAGGGMTFNHLLICKFDAPKNVTDFFK